MHCLQYNMLLAGNAAEKTRKLYQAKVAAINGLEPAMQALSDGALRGKTAELQSRYQDGESLDALLPEAFAVRAADACHAVRPPPCRERHPTHVLPVRAGGARGVGACAGPAPL